MVGSGGNTFYFSTLLLTGLGLCGSRPKPRRDRIDQPERRQWPGELDSEVEHSRLQRFL